MASTDSYGPNVAVLPLDDQMKFVMTRIRDEATSLQDFQFYADRIVRFVVEQGLSHVPYTDMKVTTPTKSEYLGKDYDPAEQLCAVSIVRAGESMEAAVRQCCLGIRFGKILIQRDEETAMPHLFYSKLPQDIHRR